MTVSEIVREYLEHHGYDGLHDDAECGCKLDDLAPCDEMRSVCRAGYLCKPDPEYHDPDVEFCIGPEKEKP